MEYSEKAIDKFELLFHLSRHKIMLDYFHGEITKEECDRRMRAIEQGA